MSSLRGPFTEDANTIPVCLLAVSPFDISSKTPALSLYVFSLYLPLSSHRRHQHYPCMSSRNTSLCHLIEDTNTIPVCLLAVPPFVISSNTPTLSLYVFSLYLPLSSHRRHQHYPCMSSRCTSLCHLIEDANTIPVCLLAVPPFVISSNTPTLSMYVFSLYLPLSSHRIRQHYPCMSSRYTSLCHPTEDVNIIYLFCLLCRTSRRRPQHYHSEQRERRRLVDKLGWLRQLLALFLG